MSSEKQVAANRQNSLKGGVKSEEGKAVSRLNARKHGIFAAALTPEDTEDCAGIEEELIASLRPVGRVEEMLVEKIALTYLRMQRCARAEAEFHAQTWEEPNAKLNPYALGQLQNARSCGARGVAFDEKRFERMVKLIDLYDARLTIQWLKLLHEVERLQRLRKHDPGAAAPEREDPSSATPEPRQAATPQPAPAPAATQTSRPPSEKLKFMPPAPQPPSVGRNFLPASSQSDAPEPGTPES